MARTLLIGGPHVSWRTWERKNLQEDDFLVLDPGDSSYGPATILRLMRGERPLWTRLYGSLDPRRAPHVMLATLAEGMARAAENLTVRLFPYRNTPLMRQTVSLVASILRPDRIVVAEGTDLNLNGFPTGPETPNLESAFPPMVQDAMRKAQWMKLLESCSLHEVDLRNVVLEGTRLGGGKALLPDEITKTGLSAVHVEVVGKNLFIVSDDVPEGRLARALDVTHCTKATIASPSAYEGLVLAFVRPNGEEIGHGRVVGIDWEAGVLRAACSAIPPVPVTILRLGSLRLDPKGVERGEARPWEV
ncbi:hypothetical protein EON82_05000 [bacterium]|nr:MAG: hypothetical protein EON82_05000 [bacterium]